MLASILIGLLLTVLSVCVHALGTAALIRYLSKKSHLLGREKLSRLGVQLGLLCSTAGALIMLHIVEVIMWAIAYVFLVPGLTHESFEESIYFSTVTYASLGYGDVVIADRSWRLLSGIQAMVGLIVFGWTTALLFALVQRIWLEEE